jgi:hypothetical protein
MAGRPRKIRCVQSYVNRIDNNTFAGPMKCGLTSTIGVTHYYSTLNQARGTTRANQKKKTYNNMVFLNITSAHNATPEGFKPSSYINYTDYLTFLNGNYYSPSVYVSTPPPHPSSSSDENNVPIIVPDGIVDQINGTPVYIDQLTSGGSFLNQLGY